MAHPQALIEAAVGYLIAWGDTAAWMQAVFSVLAIAIAIALPRIDQARARHQYGRAALAAATLANRSISGVWLVADGQSPVLARPEDFIADLNRVAAELDAFPFLGSPSSRSVILLRELARCARGTVVAISEGRDLSVRAFRIGNFSHHLLVLIARDLRQWEPPPPFSEEGVPPEIVKELARTKRHWTIRLVPPKNPDW